MTRVDSTKDAEDFSDRDREVDLVWDDLCWLKDAVDLMELGQIPADALATSAKN